MILKVLYQGRSEPILIGRLALRGRNIFFEYSQEFIQTKLELSPVKLPLKTGVFECNEQVFDGLWGLFNDSLPDGFGRLLLDRKLMQLGISPQTLNPLERLAYVGSHGMGALCYEPEKGDFQIPKHIDLDEIALECDAFLTRGDERFIDELVDLNGSSQGARPKILIRLENGEDWLVKFRSSSDPVDMGLMEYRYHQMAVSAGVEVPKARLFESKRCSGYFGVKRFDRMGDKRVHMHTVSGLLHADHRIPSLDYEMLVKTSAWLTRDVGQVEKMLRLAMFNVLNHNRDDHAKNFSFLMDDSGAWRLAPAYDLTRSSGPMGEHATTVMGEGKNPGEEHLLKLAEVAQVKRSRALGILDQVKAAK